MHRGTNYKNEKIKEYLGISILRNRLGIKAQEIKEK